MSRVLKYLALVSLVLISIMITTTALCSSTVVLAAEQELESLSHRGSSHQTVSLFGMELFKLHDIHRIGCVVFLTSAICILYNIQIFEWVKTLIKMRIWTLLLTLTTINIFLAYSKQVRQGMKTVNCSLLLEDLEAIGLIVFSTLLLMYVVQFIKIRPTGTAVNLSFLEKAKQTHKNVLELSLFSLISKFLPAKPKPATTTPESETCASSSSSEEEDKHASTYISLNTEVDEKNGVINLYDYTKKGQKRASKPGLKLSISTRLKSYQSQRIEDALLQEAEALLNSYGSGGVHDQNLTDLFHIVLKPLSYLIWKEKVSKERNENESIDQTLKEGLKNILLNDIEALPSRTTKPGYINNLIEHVFATLNQEQMDAPKPMSFKDFTEKLMEMLSSWRVKLLDLIIKVDNEKRFIENTEQFYNLVTGSDMDTMNFSLEPKMELIANFIVNREPGLREKENWITKDFSILAKDDNVDDNWEDAIDRFSYNDNDDIMTFDRLDEILIAYLTKLNIYKTSCFTENLLIMIVSKIKDKNLKFIEFQRYMRERLVYWNKTLKALLLHPV